MLEVSHDKAALKFQTVGTEKHISGDRKINIFWMLTESHKKVWKKFEWRKDLRTVTLHIWIFLVSENDQDKIRGST